MHTASLVNNFGPAVLYVAAVLGAIAAVVKLLHIDKFVHDMRDFLLDWRGQPARPGYDALPSIPERMSAMEKNHEVLLAGQEKIDKELHPNGGHSMRDDVNRLLVKAAENGQHIEETRSVAQQAQRTSDQLNDTLRQAWSDGAVDRNRLHEEVAEVKQTISTTKQEILDEMTERTMDAYELLAEHGGPDLRLPVPPRRGKA